MALSANEELVHQATDIAEPRTVEDGFSPQPVLVFRAGGANPFADIADFARDTAQWLPTTMHEEPKKKGNLGHKKEFCSKTSDLRRRGGV